MITRPEKDIEIFILKLFIVKLYNFFYQAETAICEWGWEPSV